MAALKHNDYAQAGLVDAGAEKHFVRQGPEGRWCPECPCNTIWHPWTKTCPKCGGFTIPESSMLRELPEGQYTPLSCWQTIRKPGPYARSGLFLMQKEMRMSLYARSDMMSVSIPVSSGGCGATHTRPVTHGAPAKIWKLDCDAGCEAYLKGSRKAKVIKVTPGDARAGIPQKMEKIADADPMWSSTPDTIPLTPDETSLNSRRESRGAQQIQMIQALAALRATGIDLPPEAMWLLERDLPAGVLRGTLLCPNGHDNPAGLKFCGECGGRMDGRGELPAPDPDPVHVNYSRLHAATLKKLCRENGLDDKGTKEQLAARLEAVA